MSRVLLVIGPATGGMGSHVAGLATGLPALGWSVTVFTSPQTAERFALRTRPGLTVITGWRGLLDSVRALRQLIADADVVHAHGHQAGLRVVLAARTRRRRPPVVVSWHNTVLAGGLKGRVLGIAEAVQARGADLLTGASTDLVERARQVGARNPELAEVAAATIQVLPAAASGKSSKIMDENPGTMDEKPVLTVLTVSRIAPQKRLDVLVDAAARLAPRIPGLTWLVAGDGDAALLVELQQQVARLGAPVIFLGARSDVPALMAAADVFALTSSWEARALVVQEAMAAGLPIVATAVGGLPDLIGPTGLLIPPGDPTALAEAVGRLLGDPGLAAELATAAKARFAELPTEDEVVATWSSRYAHLAHPSGPTTSPGAYPGAEA
jgi:glycosyltransferase involved in cell wall biosynthesis